MKTENLAKLKTQVEEMQAALLQLSDEEMQRLLGPGLWSGKEILGHLADSAAMNKQRIVRSQYEALYEFPTYDQAKWVQIQAYAKSAWGNLVKLCVVAYKHLIHILENLPDEAANQHCPLRFSDSDFVTLDWLVGHMFRHNDHHLHQIFWIAGKGDLPDDRDLYQPIEALPKRKV